MKNMTMKHTISGTLKKFREALLELEKIVGDEINIDDVRRIEIFQLDRLRIIFPEATDGTVRLLDLLLENPGSLLFDADICEQLGICQSSLKVYICHARKALVARRFVPGIFRVRNGGYYLSRASCQQLLNAQEMLIADSPQSAPRPGRMN